jgi:L-ectoine synthase
MIVRTLEECRQSERRVVAQTWESVRMLLKDDNMGFSFHVTTIFKGGETHIHYQNHLESVYCMSGEGEIEVIGGETYPIKPGILYIHVNTGSFHCVSICLRCENFYLQ